MSRRLVVVLAVVAGVGVAGAVAIVVLLIGLIGLGSNTRVESGGEGEATCESRFGTSCTDIPLADLEDAFEIDLPDGTTVVASTYVAFQDWQLSATFLLPEGADETTLALGPEWTDGKADEDGAYRTAEFGEDADGTTLVLTMFTT